MKANQGTPSSRALAHDPKREALERVAWERFAAAVIASGLISAELMAPVADAMLDEWRKRWAP